MKRYITFILVLQITAPIITGQLLGYDLGIVSKKSKLLKTPKAISKRHKVKLSVGDTVIVLVADNKKYLKVKYDDAIGWVNKKRINVLTEKDLIYHHKSNFSMQKVNKKSMARRKQLKNFSKEVYLFIIGYKIIGLFLSLLTGVFFLFSFKHHKKVRKHLFNTIKFSKNELNKIKSNIGSIDATVSGVALFDVLYHISKVDPLLLSGASRLHQDTQSFENYGELSDYLKNQIEVMGFTEAANKYKGYVGEENTFQNLLTSGGELEIPDSGTNPDYDFIYNGQKYDRATSNDSAYIQTKLNDKPDDVHIWVSSDVEERFANHPRVHISDDDLTADELFNVTSNSLGGMDNVGDFLDSIPLITFALSSVKNYNLLKAGSKDVQTAVEHVALDTIGVGVGGYVGSQIGLRLGQGLAPLTGGTSMIVIPAVTTLLGSIIGVMTGKGITKTIKERHYKFALWSLQDKSLIFSKTYRKNYKFLISHVRKQHAEKINVIYAINKENQNWLMKTFFPSHLTKFCSIAKKTYWKEFDKIKSYLEELLVLVKKGKTKDKEKAGIILYNQGKSTLFNFKPLVDCWERVDEALIKFKIEKDKLSGA